MVKKSDVKIDTSNGSHIDISELEAKISERDEEILTLRSQVYTLRDELHVLRNSRVLGRIIKTRDFIGNPATLPRRTVYKTRRTVAKFVPDSIRLPLMKHLRSARSAIKVKTGRYRQSTTTTKIVKNQPWAQGKPLVSVVIPYFNMSETIDETVNSLVSQTFNNFEVLIVDDGSSDKKSAKKLRSLDIGQLTLSILKQKNQGVAAARNHGISKAKGKYIICLDADDMLEPTFIEKATLTLEANPGIALVTTHQDMFGVINEMFEKHSYDPLRLIYDNMVIVAAEFRREAWEVVGGYKTGIGYEDWDFWLTLSENGFWGKLIPEGLFKYRTSMQSRYVEDKDGHWSNLKNIRSLHPKYKSIVKALLAKRRLTEQVIDPKTALINMSNKKDYRQINNPKPNVLITVPWLDFGGVSTLLYNFTREVGDEVNLYFMTGLLNKNEWEYKFKEVSPFIYHIPNMLREDPALKLEFVSNYISVHNIDVLHLVHNGFVFELLPELKKRHPKLKVITTVFNDRAPYLNQSIEFQDTINTFTTDNKLVGDILEHKIKNGRPVKVIPNGISTDEEFNSKNFDRDKMREQLGLRKQDMAVFFIGRLSSEKNPDVFVEVARNSIVAGNKDIKFFIIGDGDMNAQIQNAIFGSIKSDLIQYLGYQSNVAEYLAAADVFVLPSSIEGFPLSILEAMSMNVAVIASRVGAVPDIISDGDTGFVVAPGSVEEISDVLMKLVEDRKLLERIKRNGRDEVEEKYSSHGLKINYTRLYKELFK